MVFYGVLRPKTNVNPPDPPPTEQRTYQTRYNMYIRKNPSKTAEAKKVAELTADGKKNATSSNLNSAALYKKGTKFTCYEKITSNDGSIWARTPSGYICLKDSNTEYCVIV